MSISQWDLVVRCSPLVNLVRRSETSQAQELQDDIAGVASFKQASVFISFLLCHTRVVHRAALCGARNMVVTGVAPPPDTQRIPPPAADQPITGNAGRHSSNCHSPLLLVQCCLSPVEPELLTMWSHCFLTLTMIWLVLQLPLLVSISVLQAAKRLGAFSQTPLWSERTLLFIKNWCTS